MALEMIHRLYHPSGHYINSRGERFDVCVMAAKYDDQDYQPLAIQPDCTTCFDHVTEQRDEKIVIGYSSRSVVGVIG